MQEIIPEGHGSKIPDDQWTSLCLLHHSLYSYPKASTSQALRRHLPTEQVEPLNSPGAAQGVCSISGPWIEVGWSPGFWGRLVQPHPSSWDEPQLIEARLKDGLEQGQKCTLPVFQPCLGFLGSPTAKLLSWPGRETGLSHPTKGWRGTWPEVLVEKAAAASAGAAAATSSFAQAQYVLDFPCQKWGILFGLTSNGSPIQYGM